eukprot:TRINITY_DN9989_c1_g1_i2.p1 TRINITY_DN9989_c1_g1~~TRINITY_DN9989_c1_g1_i2.p1  ORF type:complete len:764 (+),score=206.34 TRINITY_DN9989_c1_g1_i2:71-2362(+)
MQSQPRPSRKRRQEAMSPKLDLEVDSEEGPKSPPPTTPSTIAATPPGAGLGSSTGKTGSVTVGDIASKHTYLPKCSSESTLRDLAKMLLTSGETAATVFSPEGEVKGIVTEDDVLHGYLQGAPWDITVGEWLQGGGGAWVGTNFQRVEETARPVPVRRINPLKVISPDRPLREAIPEFSGDTRGGMGRGQSRSHLLIPGAGNESFIGGVLSPVDVARAVAERGLLSQMADELGAELEATVSEVMEPLGNVPAFAPGGSMQQLLSELLASPARTVLIADDDRVIGLTTAQDALWAFHEQVGQSEDAWQRLSIRPGQVEAEHRSIATDTPLQAAASAMMRPAMASEASDVGPLRSLFAVHPSSKEVIGVVSPPDLARGNRASVDRAMAASAVPETAETAEAAQTVGEAEPAKKKRTKRRKKHRMRPEVTVAKVATERETVICTPADTLADAAERLLAAGRTAAVVLSGGSDVRGVLTENDILRALVDEAPCDCSIDVWLRGGDARLPGFMVPALTLPPKTSLAEAAASMASMAEGDSGFACHHLLVKSGGGDAGAGLVSGAEEEASEVSKQLKLLSALDIAKGMIEAAEADAAGVLGTEAGAAAADAASMTVADVMKHRFDVPHCDVKTTLADAFRVLLESGQNCALVTRPPGEDEVEGHVCGVITAADALKALAEAIPVRRTELGRYLMGLSSTLSLPMNFVEESTFAWRSISSDARLADAAQAMKEAELHHLLVLEPNTADRVVGVLSTLDIVYALGRIYMFE